MERAQVFMVTTSYVVEDKEVWVAKTDWNSYPFALIDRIGTGHSAAECVAVDGGKCKDPLMARDPWPCPYCVPTPSWTELQGSVWVAGAQVPTQPAWSPQEAPQRPEDVLRAVFG